MALIKEHIGVGEWNTPLCGNRQGYTTSMMTGIPAMEWIKIYNKDPKNCCANCAKKFKRIMSGNPAMLAKLVKM